MDGIIIVNKEKGWTSNDIVQKLKGIFHEKVGHTGTLDPMATGVLPILIGKGTSLSKYITNHNKQYIATISLGQKTTTGDSEGDCIEEKVVTNEMLDITNIKEILKKFEGKQLQIPPMYSAIKVNGKKLYEYARKGQTVEIKPRDIEIYEIELLDVLKNEQEIKYKVSCSKGTYIRTLSEDIASKLGTVGFMKDLQRIKVGDFGINDAVKISDIENNLQNIITIEQFFKDKDELILGEKNLKLFLNGVRINCFKQDGVIRIYDENKVFIGIGEIKDSKLKRDIIL